MNLHPSILEALVDEKIQRLRSEGLRNQELKREGILRAERDYSSLMALNLNFFSQIVSELHWFYNLFLQQLNNQSALKIAFRFFGNNYLLRKKRV